MSSSQHSWKQRTLAFAVVQCLLFVECIPTAWAAATDIGDIPMATKGRAKPNMIIVVDDSGSMDGEILPTRGFSSNDGAAWWSTISRSFFGYGATSTADVWQGGGTAPALGGTGFFNTTPPTGPLNFNFAGNANTFWKKFVYLFPNGQCGANCDSRVYSDSSHDHFAIAPTREFAFFRSHLYNAQYYNPAINYDPWRPYNNGTTTTTPVAYDNSSASWSTVRSHPVYPTSGAATTVNLTTDLAQPGDSAAGNRTFILYSGMILPAGARYRICNEGGGSCGAWTSAATVTTDRCIVPDAATQTAAYCHMAASYGITGNAASAIIGVGTSSGMPRRIEAQIAYYPATYWIASSDTGALAADEAYGPSATASRQRLRRVEIRSTVTSYAKAATRTDCAGATCSYTEEMTNFANWYAYYRKRHMMLNGALGLAFDQLNGLRAGQILFNSLSNTTMRDFDSGSDTSNSKRLLNDLYRVKGSGGTPTRDALEYAGNQFRRTDASAPINASCQYNAAFVITDGFASDDPPTGSYGNLDASTTNRFTIPYDPDNPALNYTDATPAGTIPLPPSTSFPSVSVAPAAPYVDAESNTLADISMHFYSNNLRPDLPARQVPLNKYDTAPDADRNDYLHMTTYALGLGVQGEIFGRTDNDTLIGNNTNPYTNTFTWPSVRNGSGYKQRHPAAIDELWHATINGRGLMLSASSPEETRVGVVDIVNSVGAKGGSGAAVAVANPNIVPGDNYSYASSYNSGPWSGDINKYEIDPATGAPSTAAIWNPSPQKQLAVRPAANRVIATFDGTAGIPLQWSSLPSTMQSMLTSTVSGVTSVDSQVLDFLRGERSREVEKFRSRGPRPSLDSSGNYVTSNGKYVYPNNRVPDDISILGDIVNGEPVVVRTPKFNYFDPGFLEFRQAMASGSTARRGVVYQGANDGMLHAFDVNTGEELWAYVPRLVFSNLRNLSDRLSFRHMYYVDGTPTVGDMDFSYTYGNDLASPGSPDWRTVLVGGLRKGGFGYYALDITNPSITSETTLASKVLWEFPSAQTDADDATVRPNIGYSFGKPVIVKTRAAGWVVAVTSGYNNGTGTGSSGGDGIGRVYILDPVDGRIIRTISTGVGSAATPSGLANLSAFSRRPDTDATTEALYGGDLLGNVWRFDISDPDMANWRVAKVAELKTTAGDYQPITVEPELGEVQGKRVIFIGAGQYLGDTDVIGNSPENALARRRMSFYALRDELTHTSATTPLITSRSMLVTQTATKSADTITITSSAVDFRDKYGWVIDLPETGERVSTNPVLSGGVITFTTNVPNGTDPCNPGGSSWIYYLDFATGGRVPGATNGGTKMGNFLSSRVVLIRLTSGQIVGLVRSSSATTVKVTPPANTTTSTGRRLSWRDTQDNIDP